MSPETALPNPAPRVLIIQGDESIAMALAFVISRLGMECTRLAPQDDALAALRAVPHDALVIDLDADTLALCAALRADPVLATIRILAMTARGASHDLRRVQAMGADGHITKPIDPAALRAEMRRLFQR